MVIKVFEKTIRDSKRRGSESKKGISILSRFFGR